MDADGNHNGGNVAFSSFSRGRCGTRTANFVPTYRSSWTIRRPEGLTTPRHRIAMPSPEHELSPDYGPSDTSDDQLSPVSGHLYYGEQEIQVYDESELTDRDAPRPEQELPTSIEYDENLDPSHDQRYPQTDQDDHAYAQQRQHRPIPNVENRNRGAANASIRNQDALAVPAGAPDMQTSRHTGHSAPDINHAAAAMHRKPFPPPAHGHDDPVVQTGPSALRILEPHTREDRLAQRYQFLDRQDIALLMREEILKGRSYALDRQQAALQDRDFHLSERIRANADWEIELERREREIARREAAMERQIQAPRKTPQSAPTGSKRRRGVHTGAEDGVHEAQSANPPRNGRIGLLRPAKRLRWAHAARLDQIDHHAPEEGFLQVGWGNSLLYPNDQPRDSRRDHAIEGREYLSRISRERVEFQQPQDLEAASVDSQPLYYGSATVRHPTGVEVHRRLQRVTEESATLHETTGEIDGNDELAMDPGLEPASKIPVSRVERNAFASSARSNRSGRFDTESAY